MARQNRGVVIKPSEVQIVHTHQRCVRRAYLCGLDNANEKSYEHRRGWVRSRLEELAAAFGIECLTYAVMSNHLHLVLRSRPDVVTKWSDIEVAKRWLKIYPGPKPRSGKPKVSLEDKAKQLAGDSKRIAELRIRLSNISWWMRSVSENISRRSNLEDEVTGHFWEGRFKATVLLDEASVLACACYVDLNPIRAAMAESIENSSYTGACDRLKDLTSSLQTKCPPEKFDERQESFKNSGWLSPLMIDEAKDPIGADLCRDGRRASNKGFLRISLPQYLELLEWTGRQLRVDKRGKIPESLAPLVERLGVDVEGWFLLVKRFRKVFRRAAGTPESLAAEAKRRGTSWICAPGNPFQHLAA
ncbi:hypothetical protein FF011L_18450 [Roseimaritima multifibrata]|uniref:Transposase IS200-like domain-containing protein n=1 Tax=Roseimaritima multifibrata TaxID=1930274 RepID=A0A517MDX7_9BACT|nr:transposase [Roseimaritima multifibrata]QDS93090.1 hypothetical protein FF011L_18450 [Roseimaritima multifibrata]